MGISSADIGAWGTRLADASSHASGGSDRTTRATGIPEWLDRSRIILRGSAGLEELSNFGVTTAPEPDAFEADLLRMPVGEVLLFSTLETPHRVTYGGPASGPDIVIIGRTGVGLQRLHRPGSTTVDDMGVGRMGFMSSFAPSVAEHVELTETTGLVMPTDLLGSVRDRLADGVGLIPDTVLTRAAGEFLAGVLHDLLVLGEPGDSALESTIVSLARTVVGQSAEPADDLAAAMRAAAMEVIERRFSDPDFDAHRLAAELHVSSRQLYRYFASAPRTIHESILSRRLAAARGLILSHLHRDLDSIARECGFPDAGSMRARFFRAFGMSPSGLRRAAVDAAPVPAQMLLTTEQAAAGVRSTAHSNHVASPEERAIAAG